MEVRRLPQPQIFVDSAIENIGQVQRLSWADGFCLRYQDSVLCYDFDGEGYLGRFAVVQHIYTLHNSICIQTKTGVYTWDGKQSITEYPVHGYVVLLASWGYVAWQDFRYHVYTTEGRKIFECVTDSIVGILPDTIGVLCRCNDMYSIHTVDCVHVLPAIESPLAIHILTDMWVCVEYFHSILCLHPVHPHREWCTSNIREVRGNTGANALVVLLEDGTILTWSMEQSFPQRQQRIVGAECLLGSTTVVVDGAVCWWNQSKQTFGE